jgi:hypothetical protein
MFNLQVEGPPLLEFIPISSASVSSDTDVEIFRCPITAFSSEDEELLSTVTVWTKTLGCIVDLRVLLLSCGTYVLLPSIKNLIMPSGQHQLILHGILFLVNSITS